MKQQVSQDEWFASDRRTSNDHVNQLSTIWDGTDDAPCIPHQDTPSTELPFVLSAVTA